MDMTSVDSDRLPNTMPALPVQGDVPFPLAVVSLVFRTAYNHDVLSYLDGEFPLLWVVWTTAEFDPRRHTDGLPSTGLVCRVLSTRELSPGRVRVDLEGLYRAGLERVTGTEPVVTVDVARISEAGEVPEAGDAVSACYDLLLALVERSAQYPVELVRIVESARSKPDRFADLIGAAVHFSLEDKWRLLQASDLPARLALLEDLLRGEVTRTEHTLEADKRTRSALEKRERTQFLRTQIQVLRKELQLLEPGSGELDQLADQIGRTGLPTAVARRARGELERLRLISIASSEYTEIRDYIEWLIHIPWTATAHERTNIDEIRRILDEGFFGQRRAKDRICEYLAVIHQTGRPAPNALCLVGPSGIGKTQLARGIARAVRRPLITLDLGLLRSEGILKGNRRTFPGAMPGRLLRQMRTAEVINPVCVLEEIDLLGNESDRPNLSGIFLETIDPSVNCEFWDHYLEFPYDLSHVLFICTATDPENIPEMLAERMEFIELPSYFLENKVEITFKHLWPQQLIAHGLLREEHSLTVAAVRKIIREYTLEAGLGYLNKALERICRQLSAQRARGQRGFIRVGVQQIEKLLGTPVYIPEKAEAKPEIGIAMGVAWTQTGGDIMPIEALRMRGSGSVVSTGSLGEVMRESIQAAHSFVRSRADWLGIDHEDFGTYDIHVHFPSGAIPKDGPSAGVTISVVIASVMSERPIRNDYALTGEVTLRGKVLPVGGVKEKVAAAHRVGIHKIIVPKQNIKDLQDVPSRISKEMTYIPVESVDQVIAEVLIGFNPKNPGLDTLVPQELPEQTRTRKTRSKARARSRTRAKPGRKRAR